MARLDDVEREAVAAAVGPWSHEVDRLKKAVLALWSARGGRLTGAELRALLSRLDVPPGADLSAMLVRAAQLGDARVRERTAVHSSTVAASVAAGIAPKAAAARAEALRRSGAGQPGSLADVLSVLAPLSRSVATMAGDAEWAVNRARNEAVVSAAAQVGRDVVFVPERDACLKCIGRSGDTGEAATADPPPVHPHCRCELEPYTDPSVPKALKREGVRSVLRGFSLPSESEAERLRAAQALLRRRPAAPESVKAYAREAVRRKKFPRGRRLP